jgi:hypothetical protein
MAKNISRGFLSGLLLLIFAGHGKAQQKGTISPTSRILSSSEVAARINDSIKKEFHIDFWIWRVYSYSDESGDFLCVLTERIDTIRHFDDGTIDTAVNKIRAINLRADHGKLTKVWEINDFVLRDEHDIQFWTRFSSFTDGDGDGLIEPLIVYGTIPLGSSIGEDGRVKFIIYYKGKKVAIRHEEGSLDGQTHTEIDDTFYALPKKVRGLVETKMEEIMKVGGYKPRFVVP